MNETQEPATPRTSTSWFRSARARWAVPGVVAMAVAGAFAVPALAAAGDDDLPDITPTELLAAVAEAEPQALSGTVVYTARLGLPDLPFADMADAGPVALLGGSTTLRVWWDGADRSRVALLGSTSEFSMVRDGFEAWTYASAGNEVVHYAPSPEDAAVLEGLFGSHADDMTPGAFVDPDELARTVLDVAEESSIVSMDADTTVAGRGAYQLVVTPEDVQTLVARVVVAVDAQTSMPLRLQVWSTQDAGAPALEVGYTDLALGAPDPAVLEFSVPVGASVREVVVPLPDVASLAGLGGAELPEGLEGLADLDLGDLQGLADLDPTQLQAQLGVDPAELERIAGLEGPERLAAMSELVGQMDLGSLGLESLADVDLEALAAEVEAGGPAEDGGPGAPTEGVRVIGSGWETVVELSGMADHAADVVDPAGASDAEDAAPVDPDALPGGASAEDLFVELDQSMQGMHDGTDVDLLTTFAQEVPEGRLVTSALLSILVTDDGRVLVGAVPGDVLRALA